MRGWLPKSVIPWPVRAAYLRYRMSRRRADGRSFRVRVGDVGHFFHELELEDVPYAVMRWSEEVPLTPEERGGFRGDVDVLVEDEHDGAIARIAARHPGEIAVELRSARGRLGSYAGMPYYPPTLATEMLAGRRRSPRGFFEPGPRERLPSLLFHLCYHKAEDSGIPTGCDDVPTGQGKRDYAQQLRAFAARTGERLPEPLTLAGIHEALEGRGWSMQLDLLARWPRQSPWIRHLKKAARARYEAAAAALPDVTVLILREDLPVALHGSMFRLLGAHLEILESGPLTAQQVQRVRRSLRGGNWSARNDGPPAGPTHYVVCRIPPGMRSSDPETPAHVTVKRVLREDLRALASHEGLECRHAVHGADTAREAQHMIEVVFGEDAATKRSEFAGGLARQAASPR